MDNPMPQGPLSAVGAAGSQATPQNPLALLTNMAVNTMGRRQSYMEQQQQSYAQQMAKLKALVDQSAQNDEAARWGAMAQGASSVAPVVGSLGTMLARTGAAYGAQQDEGRQRNLANQQAIAKLEADNLRALESRDQMSAYIKALGGGVKAAAPTVKVVDGQMVVYDPITKQAEVVAGSQDQIKSKLYSKFFQAAIDNEVPNPEQYALAQVDNTLRGFGGTTVKGETNRIPGTTPAQSVAPTESAAPSAKRPALSMKMPGGQAYDTSRSELPPEVTAEVERLVARLEANPSPELHANTMKRLQAIAAAYGEEAAPVAAEQPEAPASLPYKDKPKSEFQKESAKVSGKALTEEIYGLQDAASASSQMVGQLDLLKRLYQNPDIPEGKLAEDVQGIRSSLKTLGIDVGENVGAADLAASIAGKMALLTRTADGKNLMPGAMSDFEQRVLRSLVPGLQGTAEGRAALVDVMSEMAKSRIRFAEEASKFIDERGVVSPEWTKRKQRLMKEEMARMAVLNKQISERFLKKD